MSATLTVNVSTGIASITAHLKTASYEYGTVTFTDSWTWTTSQASARIIFDSWTFSSGYKANAHAKASNGSTTSWDLEDDNTAWYYGSARTVTITGTPESTTYYTVTLTAGTGGTVSGSGTYAKNTIVVITATPNSGYNFSSWSDGSTVASRSFPITSDVTLSASFTAIPVYLAYLTLYGMGGVFPSGDANKTVSKSNTTGANETFTFGDSEEETYYSAYTPTRTGYTFNYFYNAGATTTAVYQKTIKATTSGNTSSVYASWTAKKYQINAVADPTDGGTITGTGNKSYGTTASLTATASTGYTFDYWYAGSTVLSTDNPYEFTVTGAKTVYAHFTKTQTQYTITYKANGGTGSDIVDTVTGSGSSFSTTLRGSSFTKSYNTQTAWHTSGGTSYDLSESITISSNLTLYATWTHNTTTYFYWLGSESADGNSTTGIVQGASVTNMTATAWKSIGTKIRALQSLIGDTQSTFTTSMKSGDVIKASYYNEVTDALNDIVDNHSLDISVPDDTAKGNRLFYYLFNGSASIKQCLNNIITWYNTR